MSEYLSADTLKLLYKIQRNVLANAKDADSLLAILSQAARELSGKPGFALLFYDASAKKAHVRFSDGFDTDSLEIHCKAFTASRLGNLPISKEIVTTLDGSRRYFIPLGDSLQPFGALILPAHNEGDEIEGLDEFREIAADAISRFMEVELIRLQMAELATLLEVGKAISSTLDLSTLLRKIMQMATQVMRCETSTVYLVDKQTNELYFHIIQGDPNVSSKLQEIRLPMGTGLAGWCAKENKPVIVPDTSKDPRFFKGADKKSGFVTRSMICVPMRMKDEVIGVLQVLNRTGDIPFNDHDVEILEAIANQAVSAIDNARLYENIQKVYLSTIEVLATAIDAKDPYTQGHSRRVTQYSVAIAEELDINEKEIDTVRYAGLLHDVGKIGINDSIIRKPSRLTDEEYAIIKKHPEIGAKILRPVDFLADKVPGVKHHHEYFDGRGYPDHLKGEEIPLIARIICVADAFDAMTTDRPYRKGLSLNTAVAELKKFSGKQFDPMCVEAFLRAFDKKLFQYFEKIGDTGDMILKQEECRADELPPGFISGMPLESQPYPPMMGATASASAPSSQPFPPLIPQGSEPTAIRGSAQLGSSTPEGSLGTEPTAQPSNTIKADGNSKPPNGSGGSNSVK